jgi:hypothetical protein
MKLTGNFMSARILPPAFQVLARRHNNSRTALRGADHRHTNLTMASHHTSSPYRTVVCPRHAYHTDHLRRPEHDTTYSLRPVTVRYTVADGCYAEPAAAVAMRGPQ